MDYTIEEVIDYWDDVRPLKKTRKRDVLDERNYLLSILYYKFELTEESICTIFDIDRSSVSHAKKHAYNLLEIKDYNYMWNTKKVRERFPYVFPDPEVKDTAIYTHARKYSSRIYMDEEVYKKLTKYSKKHGISNAIALRNLIKKSLDLWGE